MNAQGGYQKDTILSPTGARFLKRTQQRVQSISALKTPIYNFTAKSPWSCHIVSGVWHISSYGTGYDFSTWLSWAKSLSKNPGYTHAFCPYLRGAPWSSTWPAVASTLEHGGYGQAGFWQASYSTHQLIGLLIDKVMTRLDSFYWW